MWSLTNDPKVWQKYQMCSAVSVKCVVWQKVSPQQRISVSGLAGVRAKARDEITTKTKNTDLRKTGREKSFTDIFHSAVACQELPMPGRSPNLARNEITFLSFQFADYDFLSPSTHPPPHLSFKITVITNPTFLSTILLLVLSRSLKSPLR